jgi:hypothetical protein
MLICPTGVLLHIINKHFLKIYRGSHSTHGGHWCKFIIFLNYKFIPCVYKHFSKLFDVASMFSIYILCLMVVFCASTAADTCAVKTRAWILELISPLAVDPPLADKLSAHIGRWPPEY